MGVAHDYNSLHLRHQGRITSSKTAVCYTVSSRPVYYLTMKSKMSLPHANTHSHIHTLTHTLFTHTYCFPQWSGRAGGKEQGRNGESKC